MWTETMLQSRISFELQVVVLCLQTVVQALVIARHRCDIDLPS